MTTQRIIIILAVALALIACAVVFDWSCSARASGQEVTVSPSTQPVTVEDGVVVVPPPQVVFDGHVWSPANTQKFLMWLIPFLLFSAVGAWALYDRFKSRAQQAAEQARKDQELRDMSERLDRQGAAQRDILTKLPPPPSPGERVG